jgi:hypothetical protein
MCRTDPISEISARSARAARDHPTTRPPARGVGEQERMRRFVTNDRLRPGSVAAAAVLLLIGGTTVTACSDPSPRPSSSPVTPALTQAEVTDALKGYVAELEAALPDGDTLTAKPGNYAGTWCDDLHQATSPKYAAGIFEIHGPASEQALADALREHSTGTGWQDRGIAHNGSILEIGNPAGYGFVISRTHRPSRSTRPARAGSPARGRHSGTHSPSKTLVALWEPETYTLHVRSVEQGPLRARDTLEPTRKLGQPSELGRWVDSRDGWRP